MPHLRYPTHCAAVPITLRAQIWDRDPALAFPMLGTGTTRPASPPSGEVMAATVEKAVEAALAPARAWPNLRFQLEASPHPFGGPDYLLRPCVDAILSIAARCRGLSGLVLDHLGPDVETLWPSAIGGRLTRVAVRKAAIIDVTALAGIDEVVLMDCAKLWDVAPLQSAKSVCICLCPPRASRSRSQTPNMSARLRACARL